MKNDDSICILSKICNFLFFLLLIDCILLSCINKGYVMDSLYYVFVCVIKLNLK